MSVTKIIGKVEKTMIKEEQNKFFSVFPSWLEWFIPRMHLSPQELIIKLRKKDTLVFDVAHLLSPFSVRINDFTHVKN